MSQWNKHIKKQQCKNKNTLLMFIIIHVRLSWSVISVLAPPCSTNSRTAGGASGLWWVKSRWPQPCVRVWFSPCGAWTSPWWSRLHRSPSSGSGRSLSIQRATSSSWGCSRRLRYEGISSSVSLFSLSLAALSLPAWITDVVGHMEAMWSILLQSFPPQLWQRNHSRRGVSHFWHILVFHDNHRSNCDQLNDCPNPQTNGCLDFFFFCVVKSLQHILKIPFCLKGAFCLFGSFFAVTTGLFSCADSTHTAGGGGDYITFVTSSVCCLKNRPTRV